VAFRSPAGKAGLISKRHGACSALGMQKTTWLAPAFEEINLGPELGTSRDEEDDITFPLGTFPLGPDSHVRMRSRRRRGGRASLPPREVQ
jgi:hypothetical protein